MHIIRRHLVSASALGMLIILSSIGAAWSAPAASATAPTLPQTAAAQSAASWLGRQFTPGGFIPLSGSNTPDYSTTVNSLLALAAANVDATTAQSALTFLEANSTSYITVDGAPGPGQLSLLILDAHALGADPTHFGATNLVTSLTATEQSTGANIGRFGTDAQVADYNAGPYDQGLALAALHAAGVTADAPAISWLQNAQCPDGGWTAPDTTTNPCSGNPAQFEGPDTNTTATAIEGLVAQGGLTTAIENNALSFIESSQDPDAGWGYEPNPSGAPGNTDPNSTSQVLQALLAMGQSPASFTKNNNSPVSTLLSFVITTGPDTGAISSPFGSPTAGDNLATYQTVPALAGLSLSFGPAAAPAVTGLSIGFGPLTGGTSVVITGTNLNALSVSFGATPAPSFIVNSPTSLTAIAPPAVSAGTVDVTVTSFGGTSAMTSADQFTYQLSEGAYSPLTPVRACDTRPGNPSMLTQPGAQCNGDTLSAGGILSVKIAGNFGVPANVLSVVLNVTVVNPTAAGFLTAFPTGTTLPTTSNINYVTGQVVPNLVAIGIGAGGGVSFYSSAATDLVVDVEGYTATAAAQGAGSGLYNALSSPTRICDTRSGAANSVPSNPCTGHTLAPGGTLNVQVAGANGVPAGAIAVVVNLTVVNPAAAGYLSAYPLGSPPVPASSNVNFTAGQTVPNRAIVALSSGGTTPGSLTISSSAATDVVIDVSGYYTAAAGSGTTFNAEAAPIRICDTRTTSAPNQCTAQPVTPTRTLTLNVSGLAGVPASAVAVVVNVTGVKPTASSYLTVFPGPRVAPTSDLNLAAGAIGANLAVATISSSGTISIATNAGSTNVIIDVLGWYAPPPA